MSSSIFPKLTSDQGNRRQYWPYWQGRRRDQNTTVVLLLEVLEVERMIQTLHYCW